MTKLNKFSKGLLTLGAIAVLAGCQPTNDDGLKTPEGHIEMTDEWTQEYMEELLTGRMSLGVALDDLSAKLGKVSNEEFTEAFDSLMYTVDMEVNHYNTVLYYMTDNIGRFMDEHPDVSFNSVEDWDAVDDGIVKGLWLELKDTPIRWVEKNSTVYLEIDYDMLIENYSSGFTPLMAEKMKFRNFEQANPTFSRKDGSLEVRNLWSRLEKLDEIKEKDNPELWDKDMEMNYYYHAQMLYGFSENSLNKDGEPDLNLDVVKEMRLIAQENEGHPVAKNMLKVVDKLEAVGEYTDEILSFTNDILSEQFSDLLEDLEKTIADEEQQKDKVEEVEGGSEE